MRENCSSGSEARVVLIPPSLPSSDGAGLEAGGTLSLRTGGSRHNGLAFLRHSERGQDTLEKRVWFSGGAGVLAQEPWPAVQREAFRRIIAWYLHECKQRGWPVSVNGSVALAPFVLATPVACQRVGPDGLANGPPAQDACRTRRDSSTPRRPLPTGPA